MCVLLCYTGTVFEIIADTSSVHYSVNNYYQRVFRRDPKYGKNDLINITKNSWIQRLDDWYSSIIDTLFGTGL